MVKECTQALVAAIQASEEYVDYHEKLSALKQDEKLYARVNEFRRKNMILHMNEDDNFHGNFADLQMEFADILSNVQVRNFLSADRKLGKLMRKTSNKVLEAGNMDIDFL